MPRAAAERLGHTTSTPDPVADLPSMALTLLLTGEDDPVIRIRAISPNKRISREAV
jgi:hypothetical protein